MAQYTQEELQLVVADLAVLSQPVKDLFNNKSTPETLEAVGTIIAAQRAQGMNTAVSQVVSGSVSDWEALQGAAVYADGAATEASLQAFNAALAGSDANALFAAAVAACLAAKKHFGI